MNVGCNVLSQVARFGYASLAAERFDREWPLDGARQPTSECGKWRVHTTAGGIRESNSSIGSKARSAAWKSDASTPM